ncbi:MAG: EamA family transporter [Spirochaetales bacterium]|nr:EamA family transporter [Spirochaetales bacterium]MBO6049419.1 EamA family transporter [Spirochaetales bacterium]MBO7348725.1 EamA family transporter [Spirochaetales bacterium]
MNQNKAKLEMIASMVIFGTIGLVRRSIPYSSAMIAFFRGIIATLVLLLVHVIRRQPFDKAALKTNMVKLLVSGAMIGFNWVLLFEAYRYTTVSVATVCYYMAPVFIMISSPFTLGEKITAKKAVCIILALSGVVLVSGILELGSAASKDNLKGVLFGLGAALLYACVVTINKSISGVSGMDRTIFQMGPAALAVLPYWLLTDNVSAITWQTEPVIMILTAGLINTALAYDLYFASIQHISAQSAALMSYIDPVVAIILSATLLREGMSALSVIGVILVLGSAIAGETAITWVGRNRQ